MNLKKILIALLPHWLVIALHDSKLRLKKKYLAYVRNRACDKYLAEEKVPRLQIGSGPHNLSGWFNTDLQPNKAAYYLDATQPFPFSSNTFQYIFSEHFIEHISLNEARAFLQESWRILQPGCMIRLSTPDLVFVMNLYQSKNKQHIHFMDWYIGLFHPTEQSQKDKSVTTINGFFHNFGHQYLYDFLTLKKELELAGFIQVKRQKAGQSKQKYFYHIERHGNTRFNQFNSLESLIVEARKPIK